MREIKFRAFDDGEMIYPTGAFSKLSRFFRIIREDAILMQYTGLKDKNGKEIYEGDIVESPFTGDPVQVAWSDIFAQFIFGGVEFNVEVSTNKIEVIGNIYETPELINS